MGTPERSQNATHNLQTQIGTPISKFEDSPVFNFINSLSPIKPVKSAHVTQTFTSLNFASPPSVFTSPHVGSHRESRFLRRHQPSDPLKSELASENGNRALSSEGNSAQACDQSAEVRDSFVRGVYIEQNSAETPGKLLKASVEISHTLKNASGSPDCDPISSHNTETGAISELRGKSTSLVPLVHVDSELGSEGNINLQKMCPTEQKKTGAGCDCGSLNYDAVDLSTFSSPGDSETIRALIQTPVDPGASFCNSVKSKYLENSISHVQQSQFVDVPVSDEKHEVENHFLQPGESTELENVDQTHENFNNSIFNKCTGSNLTNKMDSEDPYLCRGVRRRCLDFEMAGGRKNFDNGSNDTSALQQSNEKVTSTDKQLVCIKPGTDTSRCILPGIGLHLNGLAAASKDYKHMKDEAFCYGRQQLKLPTSTCPFTSSKTDNESLSKSLASVSSERGLNIAEDVVKLAEDTPLTSLYLSNEELNPSSSKKKKCKVENSGETEACKRCNCKKSKCLKLYCECFAAGVYCVEPCACQDCFNKPIHEDTVLATRKQIESRNPLAFAPKVIRTSDFASETGDESNKTPASARHKRGCNCKKSSCLKKYCECYQGGVGCSINCRCEGCKNAFGRKDGLNPGSLLIGIEPEPEPEEDTEMCEKNVTGKSLQIVEVQDSEQLDPTSAVPMTPLQLHRPLAQLPFSSNSKPPRVSSFIIGSSSEFYASKKFGMRDFLQPQPMFENRLQMVPEDEMPKILQEDGSPVNSIKTVSPNSKRVTPPKRGLSLSSVRRPGRKLILQSIPALPSLTPKN